MELDGQDPLPFLRALIGLDDPVLGVGGDLYLVGGTFTAWWCEELTLKVSAPMILLSMEPFSTVTLCVGNLRSPFWRWAISLGFCDGRS